MGIRPVCGQPTGAHATVRLDKASRGAHAGTTAARRPGIQRAVSTASTMTVATTQIQESIPPILPAAGWIPGSLALLAPRNDGEDFKTSAAPFPGCCATP